MSKINDNASFIFGLNMYIMNTSLIGCVLCFALEVAIILKEVANKWYHPTSYYFCKLISDLPPLFLSNFFLVAIVYPLTGQIAELWHFLMFYLLVCLSCEACQTIGIFTGILLSNDVASTAFVSTVSSFRFLRLFGPIVLHAVVHEAFQ